MTPIQTFEQVVFKGQFRPHQQRVLDEFATYTTDGHIHIVAAPGSGKTVLGLEMLRRLEAPALVLSPTQPIQHQWGQRFEELFLPAGEGARGYVSYDLHAPGLLTSLTYQGLYAAWRRLAEKTQDEATGEVVTLDYQGFDLLATLRKAGIRTICLDEAHHLKAAWQKALEEFLAAVQADAGGRPPAKNDDAAGCGREALPAHGVRRPYAVMVVALTATPPYDATAAEWARYTTVCGEIDAEIPAPALVQQGILCPHQDFLYFNRPTEDEETAMMDFRSRAARCVYEILESPLLGKMLLEGHALDTTGKWTDWRCYNTKGVQALLVLAAHKGIPVPREIAADLFRKGKVPEYTLEAAQTAFQFVLDTPDTFGRLLTQALRKPLADAGLLVQKKVTLTTDARLNRRLAASAAKLASIGAIAAAEQANLADGLRMLILTDHIGKELLPTVGGLYGPQGGGPGLPRALNAVTVFESVRRSVAPHTPLAILTGTLVVLPCAALPALSRACAARGVPYSHKRLPGDAYCEVRFGGGNRQKVAVLTELFAAGAVQIMVGTKALLGEGWDSPGINSLVLASCVGSFVLSNQMRGRAIRTDPCAPGKVANIWHLATVLPRLVGEGGLREPAESDDFAMLQRRFTCFMGPAYNGATIESGIERIDILRHPPDQMDLAELNRQMLALAADRARTAAAWGVALPAGHTPEILDVAEVPYAAAPPHYTFANVLRASGLTAGLAAVMGFLWNIPHFFFSWRGTLFAGAACLALTAVLLRGYYLVLRLASPKKYIRHLGQSLHATLVELGEITSKGTAFVLEGDAHGIGFVCALGGGTLREKKLFSKAMEELLSPFDSPRYLLVRQRRLLFWQRSDFATSYACPAVIASHRSRIDVFQKQLAKGVGRFRLLYTPNARQALLEALKCSYINRNGAYIESKRLVRRRYDAGEIARDTKAAAHARVKRFFRGLLPGIGR